MKKLNSLLKSILSFIIVGLFLSACSSTPEVEINTAWWNSLDGNWQTYFIKTLKVKENPTQDDFDKILALEIIDLQGYKQINTLEPLKGLNNLRKLWLEGDFDGVSSIEDLTPIAQMTNLEELNIGKSLVKDISPIAGLVNLKKLELFGTQVKDISAISELTNLEFLDCSDTQIKDLSPISNLENLKALYLNHTPLKSLKGLGNLKNIEELSFIQAKINDLAGRIFSVNFS